MPNVCVMQFSVVRVEPLFSYGKYCPIADFLRFNKGRFFCNKLVVPHGSQLDYDDIIYAANI